MRHRGCSRGRRQGPSSVGSLNRLSRLEGIYRGQPGRVAVLEGSPWRIDVVDGGAENNQEREREGNEAIHPLFVLLSGRFNGIEKLFDTITRHT